MNDKPIIRTHDNCFFKTDATANKCGILIEDYECQPLVCKWHRTKEEYLESLFKAACNYEKLTGYKDYHVRFVPMMIRNDFIEYQAKRIRQINGHE
jgi:hypothetical protein